MTIASHLKYRVARRRSPLTAAGLLAAWLGILALSACRPTEPPPPGVPDTPYWYTQADTAVWYQPAESLAVVQLEEGTPPDTAEHILYELRELGWRMTATRGPALRFSSEYQGTDQWVYQVERTEGAISPVTDWGKLLSHFTPGRFGPQVSHFYNMLPGLILGGKGRPEYFWPSCVTIVWSKNATAVGAKAWLDSIGCRIESSPQISDMYYAKRAWAVLLPPRVRLFEWMRKLAKDPRVLLVSPVYATSDPPFPDARLLTHLPDEPNPPGFDKLSPSVQTAYWLSHFSGSTVHAVRLTKIPAEFDKLHLLITTSKSQAYDTALVARLMGRIVHSEMHRMDAWIPYQHVPDLAADSLVSFVAGLTEPSTPR